MSDRLFPTLFYGLTSVIYTAFLLLDACGRYDISVYVKYTSIIVCLAAAIYIGITHKRILIIITASLTLFADTFLLLINDCYIPGVTAFALVQTLFGVYIIRANLRAGCVHSGCKLPLARVRILWSIYFIAVRIAVYIIALVLILCVCGFDATALVSAWSYVNLLFNVIQLLTLMRTRNHFDKHLTMFTAGMALFLACDTCVGLSNIGAYVPGLIRGAALSLVNYLMWVFYLPSQVLIVSAFSYNQEE